MAALLPSSSNNDNMEEIAVVLRRFGDEQSTLLDQFERLSFEVQLNQAILRRSFSEPTKKSSQPTTAALTPFVKSHAAAQMDLKKKKKKKKIKRQGSSSSSAGFTKVLKKLLKHIFVKKGSNNININNIQGA